MDLFDRLSLALPRLRLLREEPLAAHTSFRIGGPAEVDVYKRQLSGKNGAAAQRSSPEFF